MRRPVVDYREFRFSKLNTPQFSHLKLLLGWIIFFLFFFLTENLIDANECYVVHSFFDDLIPFCEWFIIPYVFWYLLIIFSLVYFALYNIDSFKKLQTFIIITQIVGIAVYIIFPNCQNLRPTEFPRHNYLTEAVAFLYTIDTNTGVCPSLHCAYSIGIASVWLKTKNVSLCWKVFIVFVVIIICFSTVFIKQHSVIDFFAAIPVCFLAKILVFKVFYKK